ncbi:hypothetical protein AB0K15_47975 [Amycolatopsis sp. NPDC049253]|uniref:hypothetical protein n=1 Tax=Amycolatopsis sp. NPDC049253 TaxID=3155274 RepID=UPI00342060FA
MNSTARQPSSFGSYARNQPGRDSGSSRADTPRIAVKVLEGRAAGEHTERNLILDLALALAEDRRCDIVRKTRNGPRLRPCPRPHRRPPPRRRRRQTPYHPRSARRRRADGPLGGVGDGADGLPAVVVRHCSVMQTASFASLDFMRAIQLL